MIFYTDSLILSRIRFVESTLANKLVLPLICSLGIYSHQFVEVTADEKNCYCWCDVNFHSTCIYEAVGAYLSMKHYLLADTFILFIFLIYLQLTHFLINFISWLDVVLHVYPFLIIKVLFNDSQLTCIK